MANVVPSPRQCRVDRGARRGDLGFQLLPLRRDRRSQRLLDFVGEFADARLLLFREFAKLFKRRGNCTTAAKVFGLELVERGQVGTRRERGFRFGAGGLKLLFEFRHG